ncbi:MAG: DUF3604 domain-containing protein, partial [Planctomycetota bacterium]
MKGTTPVIARQIIRIGLAMMIAFLSALECRSQAKAQVTADSVGENAAARFRLVHDPHATATLNKQFSWEFEWIPPRDLPQGSIVELHGKNLRTFVEWRYVDCRSVTAETLFVRPEVADSEAYDFFAQHGLLIARLRLHSPLQKDTPISIRLDAIPPYWAGTDEQITLRCRWKDDDDPSTDLSTAALPLHVYAGEPVRLGIYSWPTPNDQGEVRVILVVEDAFGNQTQLDAPSTWQLSWEGRQWTVSLASKLILGLEAPKHIGRLKARLLPPSDDRGISTLPGFDAEYVGPPVWTQAMTGRRAAFGDLHWHTEFSADGDGRLADGLDFARDHLNLGFVAPSDHNPTRKTWRSTAELLNSNQRPGDFATLFGWENSSKFGHDNYYFPVADHDLVPFGPYRITAQPPAEIQDLLEDYAVDSSHPPFLAIPHHTNIESAARTADGQPRWFAYRFTKGDSYHRLIEVFQTRGNQESNEKSEYWRVWFAAGASVRDALNLGYRVGFTGGSDNHTARPGRAFCWPAENRDRIPTNSLALTGIWCDSVDRHDVWDALFQRRTWAVWDTRALVDFRIDDAEAGSELEVTRDSRPTARIR